MGETGSSIPGAGLVTGAVQIASNILAWGYSVCFASKTDIKDIVEKSPELKQIKEDEELFSSEEDASLATQTGSLIEQAPSGSEAIQGKQADGPEQQEQPLQEVEELETAEQRAAKIMTEMKSLKIRTFYFGVATGIEKTEMNQIGKDIAAFCGQKTMPACEQADKKMAELKLALRKIDDQMKSFDFKKDQYSVEFDTLGQRFGRTIGLPEEDQQEKLRDRFDLAIEAYYAQCSEPRQTYKDDLVENAIQGLRDIVSSLDNYDPVEIAKKDTKDFTTFMPDDRATWKVQPLRIVGKAKGQVNTSETIVTDISKATVGDRNKPALVVTGVAMHAHAVNGSEGITFAYNHVGGNKVEPVIYDYANKRHDNAYQWLTGGKSGGPSSLANAAVTISRSVPPPY